MARHARAKALLASSLVVVGGLVLLATHARRAEPRLHFLMAASAPSPAFCRTLATALVHEYEPVVINWGINLPEPYRNKAAKLSAMYQYLVHNTSANDLVFMVDGSDMWIQQGQAELRRRYSAIARGSGGDSATTTTATTTTDKPIIVGADKKCYPDKRYCVGVPESTIDPLVYGNQTDKSKDHSFNRPRFVNSGSLVGYANELLDLYSQMVVWEPDPFGDQVVFSQFYQNKTHDMRVDFEQRLFLSLGYAADDAVLMPDRYGIAADHHQHRLGRLVWSRITGSVPVTIHFPGKTKPLMFQWWNQMWWARLDEAQFEAKVAGKGVRVATTGEFLSWQDMCTELYKQEQHFTLDDKFIEKRPGH
ncbi:hypothetical protein ACM66B_003325 [Microbotryomycetes sp. NB124-2]